MNKLGFNPLFSFISPVTGRLPLVPDYILVGDTNGMSQASPALIDIKLDLINLRSLSYIVKTKTDLTPAAQGLDTLATGFLYNTNGILSTLSNVPGYDATYILQVADDNLPNAQALNSLTGPDPKILKVIGDNGVLGLAAAGTDFLRSGLTSSIPMTISIFSDDTGSILIPSTALIDNEGNLTLTGSITLAATVGSTGIEAPSTATGLITLPSSSGYITQVLAVESYNASGGPVTFWMTLPEQIKRKKDDEDDQPIYTRDNGGTPTPTVLDPLAAPVVGGIAVFSSIDGGSITSTPVVINAVTGDICTPGIISCQAVDFLTSPYDCGNPYVRMISSSQVMQQSYTIMLPVDPPNSMSEATLQTMVVDTSAPSQLVWTNANITLEGDVTGSGDLGGMTVTTFAPNPIFTGNASMNIPIGTTIQRPVISVAGMIRFNTDL